jgi:glyoxylase-like metal-dependent hydrolase (beta-lactamase superfamily II)
MIKIFDGGLLGSNTYVYSTDSGHAMVIDCGNKAQDILKYANENNLKIDYIVLTHGHYDHINYVSEYKDAFNNAKIVCAKEELRVINDPEANLSIFFGQSESYAQNYIPLVEGETVSLPKNDGTCVDFSVIIAPGHTPGCMCLYAKEEGIMFTGDVLFANGYGRVDLKYASPSDMASSLRRLYTYNGVKIYPGHGGSAVI